MRPRTLTYSDVGATEPGVERWTPPTGRGYRSFERTVTIGPRDTWDSASATLMAWGVKTRSGFRVERDRADAPVQLRPPDDRALDDGAVELGADYRLTARIGVLRVSEPVRVVAVVDTPDRRGFAYGTLEGHPVSGEEAFVLSRSPDAGVRLTLRSLTAPGRGLWLPAFPLALVAQQWYRARYVRALRT